MSYMELTVQLLGVPHFLGSHEALSLFIAVSPTSGRCRGHDGHDHHDQGESRNPYGCIDPELPRVQPYQGVTGIKGPSALSKECLMEGRKKCFPAKGRHNRHNEHGHREPHSPKEEGPTDGPFTHSVEHNHHYNAHYRGDQARKGGDQHDLFYIGHVANFGLGEYRVAIGKVSSAK